MTHDELLEKISNENDNGQGIMAVAILGDALRAVVELHKPFETTPPWNFDKYLACNICETGTNDGDYKLEYPCPTIQAIEKELK